MPAFPRVPGRPDRGSLHHGLAEKTCAGVAKPRHVACCVACVRPTFLLCVLLASPASSAGAQTTLVVRDTPESHPRIERSVEEALREAFGGTVRRVASPLDELALAAGCTTASDTDPECLATIARAGDARMVAIEHIAADGDGWRAQVDLRRADGTQVSVMRSHCDDSGCIDENAADATRVAAVHHTDPSHGSETVAPSVVASTASATPTPSPAPSEPSRDSSILVVPTILFLSSFVVGVGSFIAAGFASASANDAARLGVLRYAAQVDQERAFEQQSDIALGVGIALASAGAGLAIAGAITLAGREGPRLRIGVLDVGLSVSF